MTFDAARRSGVDRAHAPLGAGVPFADVARPKPGEWPTYNGT